jgi:hypothetical protein
VSIVEADLGYKDNKKIRRMRLLGVGNRNTLGMKLAKGKSWPLTKNAGAYVGSGAVEGKNP